MPVVVGVWSLVLGFAVMLVSSRSILDFFGRGREVADPELLTGAETGGGAG
ncbi:MAG: hypothetical protein LC720_03955 [Actinobacteria bacterium]|nr:hypothetical protein [Actinomycetota bacterium]